MSVPAGFGSATFGVGLMPGYAGVSEKLIGSRARAATGGSVPGRW